jgi:hypothetical protein
MFKRFIQLIQRNRQVESGGSGNDRLRNDDKICFKPNFAGKMMYEWFEQKRGALRQQGFMVTSMKRNPYGDWKNPPIEILFKTKKCHGWIEQRDNGWCTFSLYDKDAQKWQHSEFDILEPPVFEDRRLHPREADGLRREKQFLVYSISDYDGIFEPLIEKVLSYEPKPQKVKPRRKSWLFFKK